MTSTHQFSFCLLVQSEQTKPSFRIAAFPILKDNYKVPSRFLFSGLDVTVHSLNDVHMKIK